MSLAPKSRFFSSIPAVSASFDESQLSEYLAFGYTSGENTLFSGIRKLMPGHVLRLDLSKGPAALSIERYWDVPRPTEFEQKSDEWWIGECRRRLEETVRMRLMSDVPLGMFLSGGVDSSAIAALIKRMVSGPVKTFAVGYREDQFSELGYASHVATHLGTEHHEVKVGMEDFFNALGRLIVHEDEPITWPSSVSLYFVSRLAAEHVKVVLTGEGSDELFGGYERYRHNMFNQRWGAVYGVLPGAVRGGSAQRYRAIVPAFGFHSPQNRPHFCGTRSHPRIALPRQFLLRLPGCGTTIAAAQQRRRRLLTRISSSIGIAPRPSRFCPACSMPIRKPIWWSCS